MIVKNLHDIQWKKAKETYKPVKCKAYKNANIKFKSHLIGDYWTASVYLPNMEMFFKKTVINTQYWVLVYKTESYPLGYFYTFNLYVHDYLKNPDHDFTKNERDHAIESLNNKEKCQSIPELAYCENYLDICNEKKKQRNATL